MIKKTGIPFALVLLFSLVVMGVSFISLPAGAQNTNARYEIGVVYYAEGVNFIPLVKEVAQQGGRSNYAAKVDGAHATVRLRNNQQQVFRVCSVDPTRFKLYRFKSKGNTRTVTLSKNNMWVGGSKVVLTESEVLLTIKPAEDGCFTLTPQQSLDSGEYGFSPDNSLDSFMFGVGDVK